MLCGDKLPNHRKDIAIKRQSQKGWRCKLLFFSCTHSQRGGGWRGADSDRYHRHSTKSQTSVSPSPTSPVRTFQKIQLHRFQKQRRIRMLLHLTSSSRSPLPSPFQSPHNHLPLRHHNHHHAAPAVESIDVEFICILRV